MTGPPMLELLLVGAGPHSMCTLLRLLEPAGAAIDTQRRPPSSLRRVAERSHQQRCCKEYRAAMAAWLHRHVAVVDERGSWLHRWRAQFGGLGIPYLRSTSALHVDPHDAYGLTHYAEAAGRAGEVQPLRRLGKSDAFHGPFHTPGAGLFEDHCADCVERYCIDGVLRQGKVVSLEPVYADAAPHDHSSRGGAAPAAPAARRQVSHVRAQLEDGTCLEARRVVVGIGSTNLRRLPPWVAPPAAAGAHAAACWGCGGAPGAADDEGVPPPGRVAHAWDIVAAAARGGGGGGGCRQGSWRGGRRPPATGAVRHSTPEKGRQAGKARAGAGAAGGDDSASDDVSGRAGGDQAGGSLLGDSLSESGSAGEPWWGGGAGSDGAPAGSAGGGSSCSSSGSGGSDAAPLRRAAARPAGRAVCGCAAALAEAGLIAAGDHVVIVGGGLTSAHLVHLALAGGAARVSLVTRGPLRIKQFDVDVRYMGRLRGDALAAFRRRPHAARLAELKAALQGGSMTPEAWRELQPLLAAGALALHEHAPLAGAEWDARSRCMAVWSEDGALELRADRLWLATGSAVDAAAEPLTASLLAALPVPLHGGLPALQPDLEWCPGSNIYVLGAYAALELGPGALNLAGARTGSALVAAALRRCAGAAPAPAGRRARDGGGGGAAACGPLGCGGAGASRGSAEASGEGGGGWLAALAGIQRRYLQ